LKCGGLLFDRHDPPLKRRFVVYYCSAVYSAAFAKSASTAVTARNAPMGYLVLQVAAIRFGSGCLV